mmetsp:Transcript_10722/g.24354  ORF Transcript_10722/g.24354 Transcript_10722/m.24354 type:complete len:99 (+) Transcript_10722:74-370(+)
MRFLTVLLAACALPVSSLKAGLRAHSEAFATNATVVQTAGMEGVACSEDEYNRFKLIVCEVEKSCGCAETQCELPWCEEYVHKKRNEFGACTLTGCPP